MRVAIIPPTTRTGEWTYFRYLVDGLRALDVDVRILRHFALNSANAKVFLGSLLLKLLLKNEYVSLVHNVDNLGPFLFSHNDLHIKKVLSVHDIAPVTLPSHYPRTGRNLLMRYNFSVVLPKLIANSDLVLTDSYFAKRNLVENLGADEEKIAVIHLGVDTSFFRPSSDCSEVLNKYGLRRKFLLYVGTDSPRKNLKTLVKAYSDASQIIEEDLVLVGPISANLIRSFVDTSDLTAICKKEVHGRIILLGYISRDDLPSVYTAATALIWPSLDEGFGFPPLEAMACNCPAVLSSSSCLREVTATAALYIDNPLNRKETSERILEIVNNERLRQRLQLKGYQQARRYNWERTAQKTIDAYRSVL